MSIFITGSRGFIGINLTTYLNDKFKIRKYFRDTELIINEKFVIHLAGKAHDLKNSSHDNEYYIANTELTKKVFNAFIESKAQVFIFVSSVKAVTDEVDVELTESHVPCPITHYGKSKLLAEQFILSQDIPEGKKIYILRPCMIHGPENKGNLSMLFKLVNWGFPWPLGAFENKRSFCSIENVCYVIQQLLERNDIPSGIYNLADDEFLSTNELIEIISTATNKKITIIAFPKIIISMIALFGDLLKFPLNTERLNKLTENFVVSNTKIKAALGIKKLPVSAKEGLTKTIKSFN
ncbi:MAG: NAD-dependent epimerase/dehydratase family protein [Bacteroidia bacterium]|nr:NAD-dependent epimerase/dehydratase family protein [Bacteroidia bacterium]